MGRALIREPDLFLLDEPLANLDYKLREELRAELRDLFRERQCIAVYATTEANEALALGGVTTLLDQGRIVQDGAVPDVTDAFVAKMHDIGESDDFTHLTG